MLTRRFPLSQRPKPDSLETALFFRVHCPNRRGKPVGHEPFKVYDSDASCNHLLGFISPEATGSVILHCRTCRNFFLVTLSPDGNTIDIINKDDINADKRLKCKIKSYQAVI